MNKINLDDYGPFIMRVEDAISKIHNELGVYEHIEVCMPYYLRHPMRWASASPLISGFIPNPDYECLMIHGCPVKWNALENVCYVYHVDHLQIGEQALIKVDLPLVKE